VSSTPGINKVQPQYQINGGVEDVAFDSAGNMYVYVVNVSSGTGFLEAVSGSYDQRGTTFALSANKRWSLAKAVQHLYRAA